ncbi:hypothetical protein EA658_09835 [Pseudoxanthomonas winnipegensis]|uniref:Uncharacterized protein n=1 Tax=Pseudoxanthomonas winnipegensis TaxID=2480810 RepID=A0ABY1WCR9_9GAMM|nr:hypothetical protein [Pseudoxanthomonas winnipegensis]TAA12465.1 hypothetical protein EA659_03815 [Pseudoxanthomonas winnipegensis]TAA19170.1 hypothetical protein EA658_09835 [Pseudoxanthomonas winnipegensis]TAH70431.1 hypothetical protein EA657_16900 [Pseudoxanthomonas winnipegensis]
MLPGFIESGRLTAGTVRAADEAIRILKRLRKERSQHVRQAQITALEQLVESMRSYERGGSSW